MSKSSSSSPDILSLLALSREVLTVYRDNGPPRFLLEIEYQLTEVRVLIEELHRMAGQDFPPELLQAVRDIHGDLKKFQSTIIAWKNKQGTQAPWLKMIPIIKPMVQAIAPALTLMLALQPGMYSVAVIIVIFTVFLLLQSNVKIADEITEAWLQRDLQQFEGISRTLEKRRRQLRQYIDLQQKEREASRFDVSKTLTNPEARKFWITQFGSEHHSVETSRFIETILYSYAAAAANEQKNGADAELFAKISKEENRHIVYKTMEHILDNNKDGSVSPLEFNDFLKYFGPLHLCCKKVCALIDWDASPKTMFPWFRWNTMDRQDENVIPLERGIFFIRCSSESGCFALNFNDSGVDPLTAKIRNDAEGNNGYYFSGQPQLCYPTLRDIVMRHPERLKKPYRDPTQAVFFNVGGKLFETRLEILDRFPHSYLAEKFKSARVPDEPVFLDRDPDAFAVILNIYRYGRCLVPATIPRALIRSEFAYFKFDERNVPIESEGGWTNGTAVTVGNESKDPLAPPVRLDRVRSTSPPSANFSPVGSRRGSGAGSPVGGIVTPPAAAGGISPRNGNGGSPVHARSRSFDGDDVPSPAGPVPIAAIMAAATLPTITLTPATPTPIMTATTTTSVSSPAVAPAAPSTVTAIPAATVLVPSPVVMTSTPPTGLVAPLAVITDRRGSTAASAEKMRAIVAEKLRVAQQIEEQNRIAASVAAAASSSATPEAPSTETATTVTTASDHAAAEALATPSLPVVVAEAKQTASPEESPVTAAAVSTPTSIGLNVELLPCFLHGGTRASAEEKLRGVGRAGTYILRPPSSPTPGLFVFTFLHDDGSVRPIQVYTHDGQGYADVPVISANTIIYKTMAELARALVGPSAVAYQP